MTYVIPCDQCGSENRLGLLFCSHCGARLDMANRRVKRSWLSGFSLVLRWVRLVVVLGLFAALALLCWPATPAGDEPGPETDQSVKLKTKALRGSISVGTDIHQEFTEAEISRYITGKLVQREKAAGLLLRLREVRIDLNQGELEVWMKSELFSLPLTYSFPVQITRREDGQHRFHMGRVRIGHAPLPDPLNQQAQGRMATLFGRLGDERDFVSNFPVVTFTSGAMIMATKAAENPNKEEQP